jgi:hypothetical protein
MSISMADPTGLVDVYQAFDHGLCTRNKPFPSRNWCKPADRIDHMFGMFGDQICTNTVPWSFFSP